MNNLPTTITFQDTTLSIIDHNGVAWLTSTQIAKALGYSCADSITKIFNRNIDEFSNDMTETVNLTASGNLKKTTRIFSARGCHLIGMFSRTPKAKAFRKWVLDVLDGTLKENQSPAAPAQLTYGQWLKQERIKAGLTCADLAMLVTVSPTAVRYWESDSGEPTLQNKQQIIKVLGVIAKVNNGKTQKNIDQFKKYARNIQQNIANAEKAHEEMQQYMAAAYSNAEHTQVAIRILTDDRASWG